MHAEVFCGLADISAGGVNCLLNVFSLKFVRRVVEVQACAGGCRSARRGREDERQIFRLDSIAGRQIRKALHEVSQFANVARPRMVLEPLACSGGEFWHSPPGALAELAQEM